MSLRRMFNATAVIHRRTPTEQRDSHGNETYTSTPSQPERCYFEQTQAEEANRQGQTSATQAMVVFAARTAVSEIDHIEVRDDMWSVVGEPRRPSVRGRERHVHCILQKVT